MSATVFVLVVAGLVVPLALLARRRLRYERRRAVALTAFQEQMQRMAREFQAAAKMVGVSLLPAMQQMATAIDALHRARLAEPSAVPGDGEKP